MSPAVYAQTPAASPLNGLAWKPYEYRGTGTDTLTPELDDLPDEPVRAYPGGGLELAPCGTNAAYKRHRYWGQGKPVTCEECLAGERLRYDVRKRRSA